MENSAHSKLQYIPQLDTLRFFAVFLVLVEHWVPGVDETYFFLGPTGVTFFFVLSGYLITGILLNSKLETESYNLNKVEAVKIFFIRRSLRIFPIYYLVVLLAIVLSPIVGEEVKRNAHYYLLYLNNFKFYLSQKWGMLGHTWSLAVEEQFYLFWPWIILFTPYKHLKKVILLFIVTAFCCRGLYFFMASDPMSKQVYGTVLTPLCFDAFGLGALLAYTQSVLLVSKEKLVKWASTLLVIGGSIWGGIIFSENDTLFYLTANGVVAFLSLCLLTKATYGFTGLWKKFFEFPIFIYLGKISYGIYLYHYFVPALYAYLPKKVFFLSTYNGINFFIYFLTTVLLSSLSWYMLERPLNALKKYFTYSPSKKVSSTNMELHATK